MRHDLADCDIEYVEYPEEVTRTCASVSDLTAWVGEQYLSRGQAYDFVLGHSMGGLIALQLSALDGAYFTKTIFVESFLKPSEPFYHNLMMEANMAAMGDKVLAMFSEEDAKYTPELKASLKEDFDYTGSLDHIANEVFGIYGDRGNRDRSLLLRNLDLDDPQLGKLDISFIPDSCHLPMLENPHELAQRVLAILQQS
ncbi:MAG: alpha/beta hydrolase [Candidatus Cryosericum sp.]|nr:alpha/beta hydrolase [bacterium]